MATLLNLPPQAIGAENPTGLYRAEAIITGTMEPERQRGLAECLEKVLVKVSGDTSLVGSPVVEEFVLRAGDFVDIVDLRDRMAGIPVHNEQGTRDRPYVLSAEFSQDKIDRILQKLGRKPWLGRPLIMLAVAVDSGTKEFVLAEDSKLGLGQREALSAIGGGLGLTTVLPTLATAPDVTLLMREEESERLLRLARQVGGVLLAGSLTWEEETLRWSSQWRLVTGPHMDQWQSLGTSFDTVFRDALANTAQVLSRADGG